MNNSGIGKYKNFQNGVVTIRNDDPVANPVTRRSLSSFNIERSYRKNYSRTVQ